MENIQEGKDTEMIDLNKRLKQKTRKGVSFFLLFVMLFSIDMPVYAVAKSDTDVGTVTVKGANRSANVSEKPVTTDTTIVSTLPAISTAPAVTQTPSATQGPEETPTVPTIETPAPLVRPNKISKVYLCSLGKNKVKLTWNTSKYATSYRIYRKKKGNSIFRLLGTSRTCAYTDKKISFQKTYRYKVVPVAESTDKSLVGMGTAITFQNVKAVAIHHQKYSYSEMAADIRLLTKNYHGLVQYKVIGKSEDGRNIYDVILGNPNASKTMLVISTLHAREYMASLLCMNQIEYYLQNYSGKIDGKKVKNTLDKIAIHYIPMANPDGVTISQYGIRKIRSAALRKKLYRMRRGSTKRWKANARGVDLNRNFPYLFIKAGRRGSEGYTGPRAASESETGALVKLIDRLKMDTNLKGVVNYHAMGSIVFGDCRKSGSLAGGTGRMYRIARRTTGYRSAAGYRGATSLGRGCCREYVMYGLFTPSITLEIGRRPCPGSIREFSSIWRKNRKLVLREARLFC